MDISVIVPARDVEPYVGELLEDLTKQTFTAFEVVLVDDGSTDRTPKILRRACELDPRFQLIETSGVGPGAARNAGIERSAGRYLTFVDADDRVTQHHLADLHRAVQEHQVPFAVCSGERLFRTRRFPSAVYRRAFRPPVPATSHITRRHALLYDTTMTNKLVDRDFWLSTVGQFPEGTLHEDLRPSIELHLATREVALVNERSYLWRVRSEGGASITQSRGSLVALEGRIRGLAEIHRLLEEFSDQDLMEAFLHRAIRFDLALQLKHSETAPDEYIDRLREVTAHYVDLAGSDVLDGLSLNKRAGFALLLAGRASAVRAMAPPMLKKQPAFNVEPRRTLTKGVELRVAPHDPSSFSRHDRRILDGVRVDASDTAPWATLTTAGFRAGELQLTGNLGLERLLATGPGLHTQVVITGRGKARSTEARTQTNWEDDTAIRPDKVTQGICGTFEAVVPIGDLAPRSGKAATFDVRVEVTVAPGHLAGSRIRVPEAAAGQVDEAIHLSGDDEVSPYVTKRGNLSIKVRPHRFAAANPAQSNATTAHPHVAPGT